MVVGLTAFALLVFAGWLGQLTLRGGFWRANQRLAPVPQALARWPAAVAVVPARDEAPMISRAVASLLGQDYPGRLDVVLVDDHSTDDTAERARRTAVELGSEDRLIVLAGTPLPAGWTGKLWAVEQGVRRAAALGEAPYLLLTDADIVHDAGNLRRLVAKAETERLDLVSLMALLHCRSWWERLLIPAFVFFFQMLYPFRLVNDWNSRIAAAAGGCMLVRREALARAGGLAAISDAIIDDCALARRIKGQGGRLWLGLSESVVSVRPYGRLGEIWRMVTRSAYTQLGYSPLLLAGTVLGMILLFLAPPVLIVFGLSVGVPITVALAGVTLGLMAAAYRPTIKLYDRPTAATLLLPLAAFFFTAMTVDSALRHWRGVGGTWKGRTYAHNPGPSG